MKRNASVENRISFGRKQYYFVVVFALCLVSLFLLYRRLSEEGIFTASSTETTYVEETGEGEDDSDSDPSTAGTERHEDYVAEGFEQVYLYPGTYDLTIDAKTDTEGAWFEVTDRWTNTVLASHPYEKGEEYHAVRFTTDQIYRDVVVRSYAGTADGGIPSEDKTEGTNSSEGNGNNKASLRVYGYTMHSDGKVCQDAKITVVLLLQFMAMIAAGLALWKRGKPSFLVLSIFAGVVSIPFLTFYVPDGHDIGFHMGRMASLGMSMRQGLIPERVNLVFGGDSITPIMYPELSLLGSGLIIAAGGTVMLAFKAACIFITFLTAYLSYFAGKQLLGNRCGMLFAFLYTINPFRLNELFLRATVGEAFALAFLPIAAVGLWQVLKNDPRKGAIDLIFGVTGMLSSHIAMTVIAGFFGIVYLLSVVLTHPIRTFGNGKRILSIVLSVLSVLLLNIWFLVPFLQYAGWDTVIANTSDAGLMQDTGSTLWQIFMNVTGYADNDRVNSAHGDMCQTIGCVMLFGAILFIILLLRDGSRIPERKKKTGMISLGLGALSAFMSSCYFPWRYLMNRFPLFADTLGKIQLPWRISGVSCMLLSIVTAIVIDVFLTEGERTLAGDRSRPNRPFGSQDDSSVSVADSSGGSCGQVGRISHYGKAAAVILLGLAVALGVQTATEYFNNPDYMTGKFDQKYFTNYDYMLQDVYEQNIIPVNTWIGSGRGPSSEQADLTSYQKQGADYVFQFSNPSGEEASVTVPVFWYGLHHAYLEDGTQLSDSMNPAYQFTDISIPGSVLSGTVTLHYEEPQLYRALDVVSLLSYAAMAAYFLLKVLRRRRKYVRYSGKRSSIV